ncbi:hypothetical protein SK128_024387 [Halocaridina rubra]|uniref:Fas-binding factor 1 C-terminal domain-containing protein n=2 Tax=Halocaridina rubra TaxID=373956 RepID=A0AAN9AAA7_HALRR
MSDIEISGSDSQPVSNVSPEEMARLLADLDEMDDDPFKSNLKSVSGKKEGTVTKNVSGNKDEMETKEVKSAEKIASPPSNKTTHKISKEVDEASRMPTSADIETGTKNNSADNTVNTSQKNYQLESDTSMKNNAKSKLMADLFNEETPSAQHGELKSDKSKLMSELFGRSDNYDVSNTKGSPMKDTTKKSLSTKPKTKDEVTFDDDDDILGSLGNSKPKPESISDSAKSRGFVDSLFASSSTTERVKIKEKSPEFELDEKYKSKNKNEGRGLGGGLSSEHPGSPPKKNINKSSSDDLFSFHRDAEPRRRNPRSDMQAKPFEVDDDDILSNIRSQRSKSKGKGKENMQNSQAPSKNEAPSDSSKADSWLFGSPTNTDKTKTQVMQESSIEASHEQEKVFITKSPKHTQDWLGNLLTTDKKSPLKYQNELTVTQPVVKSKELTRSSASNSQMDCSDLQGKGTHDYEKELSPNVNTQEIPSEHSPKYYQEEFYRQQHFADSQFPEKEVNNQNLQKGQVIQQQQLQLQPPCTSTQIKLQQKQIKAQMAEQLMLQQDVVKIHQNHGNLVNEDIQSEHIKELQIQIRSLQLEVGKLEAELELLQKQHAKEITILEESHRRKHQIERDVWDRTEQHLKEELSHVTSNFQAKILVLQAEKNTLETSYEAQLASVKREWSEAVNRTKELYTEMTERMKAEHSAALERMTYLKDLELNAAVSASGHVKEVEVVMNQLESNTANLSNLTASINARNDSALEMTQRALKIKEKQLKDFEAELETSRAEAESERGRLNALINRLENTLIKQGSEVEKDRWKLSREYMKVEAERKALIEERRHLQLSTETERQNLASARESLLAEHQTLLQSFFQDKRDLSSQRAYLDTQLKLANVSQFGVSNSTKAMSQLDMSTEFTVLSEEHRRLKSKMALITHQEQQLKAEEERIEQLSLALEQDKAKFSLERDFLLQEKTLLTKKQKEVDSAHEAAEVVRNDQQSRLAAITKKTQALHYQQENIKKEVEYLEKLKVDVSQLMYQGLCPSCQSQGITASTVALRDQNALGRLPGDGGECHRPLMNAEPVKSTSMAPSQVLARLAAARERENLEKEKRLLQIAAFENS